MHASPDMAAQMLEQALAAVQTDELLSVLDELSAPIYVTDASGLVTYFNPACIDFAGRTPALGQDRWCVTWKLYTDEGEFLPHEQCPMAEAIRTKSPVRGVTAVAERPDGTRVNFMPYPTPVLGADGELTGAVNMLIDVTEQRQAEFLRAQARRCRRLVGSVDDRQAIETLELMANEYDAAADGLDRKA